MVAAAAFVIGFALIGLSVLGIAMRGGPRGARKALHTQTARGRTAVAGIVAGVAVVFGVGIPAAVLAGNSGTNKNAPGGVRLSSDQTHGRELFAHNCATCHTLRAASAQGKVGPNLDELRPPKGLVLNAIEQGRARGQGQMPPLLLTGKDAQDVAGFVSAVAGH
jgi:mono/diheme cytochrome c family protein